MKTVIIPESLAEVREWKKKAGEEYARLKHLEPEERVRIINARAEEIMKRYNLNLPRVRK